MFDRSGETAAALEFLDGIRALYRIFVKRLAGNREHVQVEQ